MSECWHCQGTGRNRHSGWACDYCKGTGEHSYLTGCITLAIILVSVAGVLHLGRWLYLLVTHK